MNCAAEIAQVQARNQGVGPAEKRKAHTYCVLVQLVY